MVVRRQSEPYWLSFERALGTLRCRAFIHSCMGPRRPNYVRLKSAEELLPHFEEYWQGYTLAHEPHHCYVSNGGDACIRVNLD